MKAIVQSAYGEPEDVLTLRDVAVPKLKKGEVPVFRMIARTFLSPRLPKSPSSTPDKMETLNELRVLLEAGKITPIIGKTFPLREAAQAIRYLADGRAMGRVILAV